MLVIIFVSTSESHLEVDTKMMTSITMDPAKFVKETFIAAMKKRLGSSYVTAAVKHYKILVEYLVSKDMTVDTIKQALKTALSVADNELVVSIPDAAGGRRLAETKKAAVELKVTDQKKAVTLTQSAGTEKT